MFPDSKESIWIAPELLNKLNLNSFFFLDNFFSFNVSMP